LDHLSTLLARGLIQQRACTGYGSLWKARLIIQGRSRFIRAADAGDCLNGYEASNRDKNKGREYVFVLGIDIEMLSCVVSMADIFTV